ncbi:hypothetical protein EDD99_2753 [Streptomyces sp. 846.5]|nr:hypothetical protein [Streptomyces sp. 846.5]TDU04296.1 hypothetical protein EDD99_2753 [Streptomyces sp. 846.5]
MRRAWVSGIAVAVLAGQAVLGVAGTARAASSGTRAAPCSVGSASGQPLGLALHRFHRVYRAGGSWSGARLGVRNHTGASCRGVQPVLVLGAHKRGLRAGEVRLQWRRGAGASWQRVRLLEEDGALLGRIGPADGLAVTPKGRASVPLRLRFSAGAPLGRWVTLAVGYVPVPLEGEPVPLPVGITDPHFFRVVGGQVVSRHVVSKERPQLAATGGSEATAVIAWAAALSVGGGAALVGCARRRRDQPGSRCDMLL